MADPTQPEVTRVTMGEVLSATFSIWGKNLGAVLGISMLAYSPLIVAAVFFPAALAHSADLKAGGPPHFAELLPILLARMLCGTFLMGALTEEIRDATQEQPINLAKAAAVGLRRFFPVLWLSLLLGVGVGAGFVLLIVPGILLALRWIVAIPAIILEPAGISAAFSRSAEITKGSRGMIFGLLFVFGLLVLLVPTPITYVLAKSTTVGANLLREVITAAQGSLWPVLSTVLFVKLRAAKEGPPTQQLAEVFA